jgi:uncharacterized delta-60 repeat protein
MKQIYLFLCLLNCYYVANAQAGSLDSSFGVNGIQTTGIKTNRFVETGVKVLRSDNGSILIVFGVSSSSTVVAKYLPTGIIDSSFGKNGYSVPLPINPTTATLQDDGKIIVVGDELIGRFNADGSIDRTFSNTGVKMISTGLYFTAIDIAIKNNEIYIAGSILTPTVVSGRLVDNRNIVVCRLSPDGSSNSIKADYTSDDKARGLAIIGDKIVVAGSVGTITNSSSEKFALFAYNLDLTRDQSFGVNGLVTTDFGSRAYSIVAEGNKLVAVGLGVGRNVVVARYNLNGTLDNTFSEDGKANSGLSTYDGNCLIVTVQGDKIVMAGSTPSGFAVEKFYNNGLNDNSYGKNGIMNYSVPNQSTDIINMKSINIIGENTVATGSVRGDYIIGNFYLDGTPNTSFSNGGWRVDYYPTSSSYFKKVTTQTDGKIVTIGSAGAGNFYVARYTSNGFLDQSFGQNGTVTTSFGDNNFPVANAVCLQDDKIIVAGTVTSSNSVKVNAAVARYNSDGTLDSSFGVMGRVIIDLGTTNFGSGISFNINSIAVTAKGDKIVAVGYTSTYNSGSTSFAIARFNLDGSFDKAFDNDGIQTTSFTQGVPFGVANSIVLQNEKILVLGTNNLSPVIARYNDNGSLDNSFGNEGKLVVNLGENSNIFTGSLVLKGDKILVANYGYINRSAGLSVLRYNTDGSLDPTFVGNTKIARNFPAGPKGNSIYIQDDDKIILTGNISLPGDNRFIIGRYNPNNTSDSSFGLNGIQTIRTEYDLFDLTGIAVSDKKLFAVGSSQTQEEFGTRGAIAAFKLEEPAVSACATGSILREYWADVPGTTISDIPLYTTPTSTSQLNSFETPANIANNFAQRVRGYICAPATGNYTFYIASDDQSELWLSTSDNPDNKRKIASVSDWTEPKQWGKYESQKSVTILLQANTKYYIEALNKEGEFGDNLAVGWSTPGSSDITVIPGSVLSPYIAPTNPPVVCSATGSILREYWANIPGNAISDIPVFTTPTSTSQLNSIEAPADVADNYAQRIRGYICAPATGNYTFYIAGDDESELWLSTSDNPDNKQKIASLGTMGWTGSRQWNRYESQKSVNILLQANTKYYIEVLHKEGGGGDNLAVGWSTPGSSDITVIPGSVLSPFMATTSQASSVTINKQEIGDISTDNLSLSLKALPNPSSTHFTINIKSNRSQPVDLKVFDAVGRVIETKRKVSPNGSIIIGDRYQSGMYYLQAVQGSEKATLKLIKRR